MRKKIIFGVIVVAVAVAAIYYINRAPQDVPPPVVDETPALRGWDVLGERVWVWSETTMREDGSVVAPKDAGAFTLTFADGRASGTTDCNSFGGDTSIWPDGSLSFGVFTQTKMACTDSQEEDFLKMLARAQNYSILEVSSDETDLLITTDVGVIRFVGEN